METIEAQILKVEKQIEDCGDPEERKQLRKKKEQLREEKLILLRRETVLTFGTGSDTVPPFRLSTFVLCYASAVTGKLHVCGTAFAVASACDNLLLSAGHCIKDLPSGTKFFCTLHVQRDGHGDDHTSWSYKVAVNEELFPVVVIFAKLRPDVAVLRRSDGGRFKDAIQLSDPATLPWVSNPSNWACNVHVFHCPAMVVSEVSVDYLDFLSCQVDTAVVRSVSSHHVVLDKSFLGGSSGGAVVLKNNQLLALNVRYTTSGRLTMENLTMRSETVRTTASDESAGAEPKGESKWEIVSFSGQQSISNIEVSQAQAIAVVPSLLMVQMGPHIMPLRDWLQLPPDEMKLEPLHDIASKCGLEDV